MADLSDTIRQAVFVNEQKIPAEFKASIAQACAQSPALAKLVAMREEDRWALDLRLGRA